MPVFPTIAPSRKSAHLCSGSRLGSRLRIGGDCEGADGRAFADTTEELLAAGGSHPRRRWSPSEIASNHAVDTAVMGVSVYRYGDSTDLSFPPPEASPARSAGGCPTPYRCLSQPTRCSALRSGRGTLPPLQPSAYTGRKSADLAVEFVTV